MTGVCGKWILRSMPTDPSHGICRMSPFPIMKKVALRAGSLDALLAHRLCRRVFEAIQEYYGEARFSRDSFDAILGQLAHADAEDPAPSRAALGDDRPR